MLVNVLTALIAFRFLRQLSFSVKEAILGVLALLLCTTHLHYTQNMQENNYIMLLTLTGFSFQYEWLRTGSRRALWIGSGALGLNLLTRLTTGLDLIACGVFLLLILRFERRDGQTFWQRFLDYIKIAAPVYAMFLVIDRAYNFYRFAMVSPCRVCRTRQCAQAQASRLTKRRATRCVFRCSILKISFSLFVMILVRVSG